MNQNLRLTHYLLLHGNINPLDAWRLLGIYRLSDTIFRLRKDGWKIRTENKTVINSFNEKCVVANYILEEAVE